MTARAAHSVFPFPDHRTMNAVLLDEMMGCGCTLPDGDEGHSDDCPMMASWQAEYGEQAA